MNFGPRENVDLFASRWTPGFEPICETNRKRLAMISGPANESTLKKLLDRFVSKHFRTFFYLLGVDRFFSRFVFFFARSLRRLELRWRIAGSTRPRYLRSFLNSHAAPFPPFHSFLLFLIFFFNLFFILIFVIYSSFFTSPPFLLSLDCLQRTHDEYRGPWHDHRFLAYARNFHFDPATSPPPFPPPLLFLSLHQSTQLSRYRS